MPLVLVAASPVARGQEAPTLSFNGRAIRFGAQDRPYYEGHTPMFSLRSVCNAMGASAIRSRDAIHWTVRRGADRLDYAFGERWYIFNGAKRDLQVSPEGRGEVLFVPMDFLDPLSGGGLELNADSTYRRVPEILYRGHAIRYRRGTGPMRLGSNIYVAARETASALGAGFSETPDRFHITVTRSLDKLDYDLGSRSFVFNGAQKFLRNCSITRGREVFVPIEMFQALVGDELHPR